MPTAQIKTLLQQQQSYNHNLNYLSNLEDAVEYALNTAKSDNDIKQQKKLFAILRTIMKEKIRYRMRMAQNNLIAEKSCRILH